MSQAETIIATIYCGLREGYDGAVHTLEEAMDLCQEYVDAVGLCVTVTETNFVYKGGREPGIAVGLINYPRFPSAFEEIFEHAMCLAGGLQKAFKQNRVSVVTPRGIFMLGDQ